MDWIGRPFLITVARRGVDAARWVDHPAPVPPGTVMLGIWERAVGGPTTWRLNTLNETGGYRWSGMVPPTPANAGPFTVGSMGRGLHLAQLMMWPRVLDSTDRNTIANWLFEVWGLLIPIPSTGPPMAAIPNAAIPSTQTLVLWLDACDGLYRDTNGLNRATAGAPVALWRDRSGKGNDVRFTSASLVQPSGPGLLPLVSITGTGTFDVHPLRSAGSGPFCIVAVWQVLAAPQGGGHPFNVNKKGYFGTDGWQESIALSTWRVMPTVAATTQMVLGAWHFDGAVLTNRFGSLLDGTAGYKWVQSISAVSGDWTTTYDVTVGTVGKQLQLAELLVWQSDLSQSGMGALDNYLRARWNVPKVTTGTVDAMPARGALLNASLPAAVPQPYCWLDATNQGGLYADAAGQVPAEPGQSLRMLADKGSGGCHYTWPTSGVAIWMTDVSSAVNGLPVVAVFGPGSFVKSPLVGITAASGHTIVALWRLVGSNGGGHPLAVGSNATFSAAAWTEGIASDTARTMPSPSVYGITNAAVVAACWHGDGTNGTLTWMLRAGDESTPGYSLSRTESTSGNLWTTVMPTIGTTNKGLQLAELLVWRSALSAAERGSLQGYLSGRWGVSFPVTNAIVSSIPAMVNAVPDATLLFAFDATTATQTMFKNSLETAPVTSNNDPVHVWKASDGTMKDTMKMISSGTPPAVYHSGTACLYVKAKPAIGRTRSLPFRHRACMSTFTAYTSTHIAFLVPCLEREMLVRH